MHPQTYSIIEAVGSPSSVALILELLGGSAGVTELTKLGVSKSTVSKQLKELDMAGVLSRQSWNAYEVTCPDETRRFLEAAHELAIAVLDARRAVETKFGREVRKTRLQAQPAQDSDVSEPA